MFELRIDNEKYKILDDEVTLEELAFSMTELKPNQETLGSVSDLDEIYIFKGEAKFIIENQIYNTVQQDYFLVKKNMHRKILNTSSSPVTIYNIWKKSPT